MPPPVSSKSTAKHRLPRLSKRLQHEAATDSAVGASTPVNKKAKRGAEVARASTPPSSQPSLPRLSTLPRPVPRTRGQVDERGMDTIRGWRKIDKAGRSTMAATSAAPRAPAQDRPPCPSSTSEPRSETADQSIRGQQAAPALRVGTSAFHEPRTLAP